MKLGGLKFGKIIDDEDWSDSSDESKTRFRRIDARKLANSFDDDKYQVAVMLYFFVKRSYIPSQFVDGFEPDWTGDRSYAYKRLHAKHLVNMIRSDPSMTIPDILCHPYFMSVHEIIAFEDRLRTYNTQDRNMDAYLEEDKVQVFGGDWTRRLEAKVVNRCLTNSIAKDSFIGLWQARRNRRHHRDQDNETVRDLMGPLLVENFEYWEAQFPAFFLYLFKKMAGYNNDGSFLYSSKEFNKSAYFQASPAFYALCADTPIYE